MSELDKLKSGLTEELFHEIADWAESAVMKRLLPPPDADFDVIEGELK